MNLTDGDCFAFFMMTIILGPMIQAHYQARRRNRKPRHWGSK